MKWGKILIKPVRQLTSDLNYLGSIYIHMTSDVFGVFLTYLPTLIRYFTTQTYLVKSDAAWPTYLKIWRHIKNSPIVVVDNFTYHSEKSVISLPKSFNVFFTRLYSSTSMVVGMGLKPYFWPPKKTKLGPKDMSLQFWISSRQIP